MRATISSDAEYVFSRDIVMKQVFQSLKNGQSLIAETTAPSLSRDGLVVLTSLSLISAGTERMLVDFGKASFIDKARQQPDKVKMVLEKVRTDGLGPTLDAVRNKLDQPIPMGYCNVGIVAEIGKGVSGFSVGGRVASNGNHAEVVAVPQNLCARIPDTVTDEAAAFTVVASIGLQGIRLVQPTLGETVVVTGLGLIGLLTVQLLRAHGCHVIGIDPDPSRAALARQFGAHTVELSAGEDPIDAAMTHTRGCGVDAVIITASTKSNEPVSQAAKMCRKRGRIVLVGVTGLELSRADFYEKELTFQVSCSYGPGHYDPEYEEKGHDYPIGFVRWTEQRNFEAVLDMMADGRLNVEPLITHRFALDDAAKAYEVVAGSEPSLGILLEYPQTAEPHGDEQTVRYDVSLKRGEANVAVIGAGNYAGAVLIPAFKTAGANLVSVASSGGVSGVHLARKFGFAETTTDTDALFARDDLDIIVVATRHNSHAALALRALEVGKHLFVEKPLCLTLDELSEIESTYQDALERPVVMVGFNRRFAPHVQKIHALIGAVSQPKTFVMTVNAGAIPPDHWTQDPEVGGGRVVGEACHFIDLLRYLAGAPIAEHHRTDMESPTGDTVSIQLRFADGSMGTILYLANGSKSFPKERLEVFTGGRILQLDNFRTLTGYGWPGFRKMKLRRQDKGQRACVAAFLEAVKGNAASPIPFEEIVEVSRVSIELARRN